MTGRIHSRETFGTVDGPGVRYVLFMQGCHMRCRYCHNPDTWDPAGGEDITAEEVLSEYRKNRAFYKNGGITVTGGEPLLQPSFLAELFRLAKADGIHTCLDTSGFPYDPSKPDVVEKIDAVLRQTDLVMLDIKHIDPAQHRALTGWDNQGILAFAKHLEALRIPVWIRHIVVRGLTDRPEDLQALGRFIGGLRNLRALDVLPYHTMGVTKYHEMGIPYTLEGVEALPMGDAVEAKRHILEGIKETRPK